MIGSDFYPVSCVSCDELPIPRPRPRLHYGRDAFVGVCESCSESVVPLCGINGVAVLRACAWEGFLAVGVGFCVFGSDIV